MQPSSTRRWPWPGSRPVVSVSTTISRICLPAVESFLPLRHCSNADKNITHLSARSVKTLRCIHHEIRASSFFRVRHLFGKYRGEFLFGHARARENAGPLHSGRRRDHDDRVATFFPASLKQQWNVEHRYSSTFALLLGEKTFLGGANERMNDRFKLFYCGGVVKHLLSQFVAVDLAPSRGAWKRHFDQRRRLALIEAVDGRIRIMNRYSLLGEELRRRRLAHA